MDTVKRVHELAKEHNITVYQLFKDNGMNFNTFSSAERRGGQLSVETIDRICSALGITLSEFFSSECSINVTQDIQCEPLSPEEIGILREMIKERDSK